MTGGVGGAVIPTGSNTNETLYMIRHANAHPTAAYANGNFVGAGQWRALDLPNTLANALAGKVQPSQVYSLDPAQIGQGTYGVSGNQYWSHATLSMTAEPYAIANNLPYSLVSSFLMTATDGPQLTSNFFFTNPLITGKTNPQFSGQTFLLAWEHTQIPLTINALLSTYYSSPQLAPTTPDWPSEDYDTIWTVKLDAQGNLTVDNTLCEGINSATLPATAPQFQ